MKMVTRFVVFVSFFACSCKRLIRKWRWYLNLSFVWLIFLWLLSLDLDSDSEGSQHSTQSVQSEKTLLEKLEILSNQGLIQVVKVFVDWLRTNTDIILMCAQVRDKFSSFVYETLTF